MMVNGQLKEDTGYNWVMTRVQTASPFGHALVRKAQWYGPQDGPALQVELGRVEALLELVCQGEGLTDQLTHTLSEFHDIRNSFNRSNNAPMDEVELFEVKHFLIHLERLQQCYSKMSALEGISLPNLEASLDLLDPSGRRLPAFALEVAFDPALERIRAEKKELELALRQGDQRDPELMAQRRALVLREDRVELDIRKRLTMALLREREVFFTAMEEIGRLDLILAKARLARRFGCCRPQLAPDRQVHAVDMIHPQVADHLKERGGSFAPVSLTLEPGSTVITGANMGGKSVSMKSVTLNLLLMQTGYFTFAQRFSAPLFDSVTLICADGQSVEQGLSSFGAEVDTLGQLLAREKGRFFFVALDEFARGTNPREGAGLARALVEYLNSLDCVALMTTHYDGVSDRARRHYRVAGLGALDTASFRSDESPLDRLSRLMDYNLIESQPGEPCPRDALRVCRLLDLEPELMAIFEGNENNQKNF